MTRSKRNTASIIADLELRRSAAKAADETTTPETRVVTGAVAKGLAEGNRSLDEQLRAAKADADAARQEAERLKREVSDGRHAIKIDPRKVRRSAFADRHPVAFTGNEFESFVQDIRSTGGNVEPGRVRPIANDPNHDYELASGHRRHAACLEAGLPFLAICLDMSDADLVEQMRIENRGRKDLSPFELGCQYARLIEHQIYPTQTELAASLGEPLTSVHRLIRYGSLGRTITEAFPDPRKIRQYWITPLLNAYNRSPDTFHERLDEITEEGETSANAIFAQLTAQAQNNKVYSDKGKLLVSRRTIHQRPALVLYKGAPNALIEQLEAVVRDFQKKQGDK